MCINTTRMFVTSAAAVVVVGLLAAAGSWPWWAGLSATQARAAVPLPACARDHSDEQASTLCDLATSFEAGIVNWQTALLQVR
ncbi:MAG: hypothetical protein E6Q93_11825 [Burkholderiaceae bacterium]|nr:MAG: hypothetical protein E6Q93_11825 [Burkholderiaceae bacterium]